MRLHLSKRPVFKGPEAGGFLLKGLWCSLDYLTGKWERRQGGQSRPLTRFLLFHGREGFFPRGAERTELPRCPHATGSPLTCELWLGSSGAGLEILRCEHFAVPSLGALSLSPPPPERWSRLNLPPWTWRPEKHAGIPRSVTAAGRRVCQQRALVAASRFGSITVPTGSLF